MSCRSLAAIPASMSHSHAPYGTACLACSQSKCRCVTRGPGVACARCERLGKECLPSVRSRNPQSRSPNPAPGRDHLEAKIDGLVSLLTSNRGGPLHVTGLDRIPLAEGRGSEPHAIEGLNRPAGSVPQLADADADATALVREMLSSLEQEEEVLVGFRTHYLVQFPFIYIPLDTTVDELRSSRPFLWLCIVAVSARSAPKQADLYAAIRRAVAQTMVVDLERSIDQLLGLLVCISWGNLQASGRPFFSTFIQLAMSTVFDLGLNKTPPENPEAVSSKRVFKVWTSHTRSMEERRAVLGCYFMSSLVSSYLHHVDTLQWTPHMTECLQFLADSPEWNGDSVFATLVKCRLICEKVRDTNGFSGVFPDPNDSKSSPSGLYTKVLVVELEEARSQAPSYAPFHGVVATCLFYTEFAIYECYISSPDDHIWSTSHIRIGNLYSCLHALKSYFEAFLQSIPPSFIGTTNFTTFQMFHSLYSLHKLSTMEDPGWDTAVVVEMVDVVDIGRKIAHNLRDAVLVAGLEHDGQSHIYSKMAAVLESKTHSWSVGTHSSDASTTDAWHLDTADYLERFLSDIQGGCWMPDFALAI
ncbi:hypothetical protein GQ53DRAFT_89871 [Thozetella sp. PMI_491]|nr:hypothetical protein GQ53DRAFT_89871 [Thozetella sp. PMI_491]